MTAMRLARFIIIPSLITVSLLVTGCNQDMTGVLSPKDFLNTPGIIDPGREFGHLGTVHANVPATSDIFLSGAKEDVELISYPDERTDRVPENSPIKMLEGTIFGGETLDIYATGKVRLQRIEVGPNGGGRTIEAGPAFQYKAMEGQVGALVGMFSNQKRPFVIGQRRKIIAPRGARHLYLAVLDYPGASSNNQGAFDVSISVIRR